MHHAVYVMERHATCQHIIQVEYTAEVLSVSSNQLLRVIPLIGLFSC
jgi:hypothetical protein